MLETLDVWSSALVAGLIAALMVPVNLMPDSVSEAFQYAFMQRALLTSMMVGAICGMLSCYVVLKRWSLLGMRSLMRCCLGWRLPTCWACLFLSVPSSLER
ncbi:hypothetical protein HAALTHF_40080n [Vreelandella aquamarina]|nr:hypothetical protein HAALTHF_40080n [Halomonas axialensis]